MCCNSQIAEFWVKFFNYKLVEDILHCNNRCLIYHFPPTKVEENAKFKLVGMWCGKAQCC